MPAPDYKAMSDAELTEATKAADIENKRRGQFRDAERFLSDSIQGAKDLGIPKTQVTAFLTRIVDRIYGPTS